MHTYKNIALLAPIFISAYAAILLLFNKWKYNRSKIILGTFMLFTSIIFLSILLYQTGNYEMFSRFDPYYMSLMVLFQPLFYIYIWSMTMDKQMKPKLLLHFIPFVIILALSLFFYSFLNTQEKIYYLSEYLTGNTNNNLSLRNLHIVYNTQRITYAIQSVTYFILVLLLLKKHKQRIEDYFSSTEGINLNWLFVFNILFFMGSLNGIAANFIPLDTINNQDSVSVTIFIVFALFYGATGILGLKQKPVYSNYKNNIITTEDINKNDYEQSTKSLKNELLNYFKTEKPYLRNDIKITDISKKLKSNRTYISKLINDEFSSNFCNFVNSYRLKEAKELMKDKTMNNMSLETIAELTGFNSFTSFFRVFKRSENQTPANYRKSNQKEYHSV